MSKSRLPSIEKTAFHCPYCNVYAHQHWHTGYGAFLYSRTPQVIRLNSTDEEPKLVREVVRQNDKENPSTSGMLAIGRQEQKHVGEVTNLSFSSCESCSKVSVWIHDRLLFPKVSDAPRPASDLPETLVSGFLEARDVLVVSPRAAAALLRLTVQELCIHLGQSGNNLNKDIANLVRQGLPAGVQQALDIVRVTGNHAVHPGVIDFLDNRDTALSLFRLINLVVEKMISEPKEIDALFASLPEEAKEQIKKRDENNR